MGMTDARCTAALRDIESLCHNKRNIKRGGPGHKGRHRQKRKANEHWL